MAEYELALESGAPLRDAYGGSQIEILRQLSRYYREQGSYAEVFERLERQYFLARVSHGLFNARHVPVLQELAELALLNGDPHRSQELRLALLNLQIRAYAEDDPRRTDARLLSLQHFVESDDYFRRAFVHYRPDAGDALHRSLLQAVLKWQTLHIVAFRTQQFPQNHPHQDPLGQAHAIDQLLVPRPRPSDVSAFLRQLVQHDQPTTGARKTYRLRYYHE